MLEWLVNFAQITMRNRYFPDKAVDLLEQCYAHALTRNKKQIDLATAQEVAQRLIGMPVSLTVRLDALRTELAERSLLSEDDATQLLSRLQVTLRGLDMRSARPNAILLLSGEAAEGSSALEEVIASTVFGAADRVVKIDCSRFGHPEDINLLVGAPPGYVGYSDSLPIHRILQTPWCVLSFENIDLCNIQVREVITRAFEDGVITDGRGKAIYLSDTIVLLTAHLKVNQQQSLGFMPQESRPAVDLKQIAEASLGSELAAQVDLIAVNVEERIENRRQWLEKHLLAGLTERYAKEGILLDWDSSVKDWLISQQSVLHGEREWERFIDEVLTPLLIPYLSSQPEQPSRILNIAFTTHLEISSV
jgi:ATP-dependent Clp protease ATP-binding subunit ClpC